MPTPIDPERYRRRRRRRATIGWIGGLLALAGFVVVLIADGESERHREVKVPYGEVMTSADYGELHDGEEEAAVLERLDATGRPEGLTEPYVLVLFPPPEGNVECTYWEFSDQPQIFARLCFDEGGGELVQKRQQDVLHPPAGAAGEGQMI